MPFMRHESFCCSLQIYMHDVEVPCFALANQSSVVQTMIILSVIPFMATCACAFEKQFVIFLFCGHMNILKSVEYCRGSALQKEVQEGEKYRSGMVVLDLEY